MPGGKPADPEYWRRWRAAHPAYVARERDRSARRRAEGRRGDRSAEYANRAAHRASRAGQPLTELFPDLVRLANLLCREEDLDRDIRQEVALALLEGRDPAEAEAAYRRRERRWWAEALPLRAA